MTSAQRSYLDEAAISALAQDVGVDASVVTATAHSNMGSGSLWGIQWTVAAPSASTGTVNTKLNQIAIDTTQFASLMTAKLTAEITAAGGTFSNTLEVSNFVVSTVPVTVRLYTLVDDKQPASARQAAAPSLAWIAPILGVSGLFSLISFIGIRWNRRITREVRLMTPSKTPGDEENLISDATAEA